MKKIEASSEPRDRLSELSDSLIFDIFEFLPMKDIVKTQILSRRWENLWTLTPYLYFDDVNSGDCDKFRNFVNRSLLSWRGEKIKKFKIKNHQLDALLSGDMDLWVRFAVDNGVEELDTSFNNSCFDLANGEYLVPQCLYSSPSLRKLMVFGSVTNNDGYGVQWQQLKVLKIQCVWMTQHSIDQVLSGIPVLEDFFLAFQTPKRQKNHLSLSFRSTSLKKLYVGKIRKNVSRDTELRIRTPNLETLTISGGAYGGCLLMDVSSLTRATLSYKHLRLSQLVEATASNEVLSPLSTVVYLNLNGGYEGYEQLVGFLEFFPKLKTLSLGEDFHRKSKKNLKQNSSMASFLVELRKVEVTWNMRDFSIFSVIAIVLNHASKLEKMVFRVKQTVPPSGSSDSLRLASTKLMRMRRSSPTVEFIFQSE